MLRQIFVYSLIGSMGVVGVEIAVAKTVKANRPVSSEVNPEVGVAQALPKLPSSASTQPAAAILSRFPESGYSRSNISLLVAQAEEASPSPADNTDRTTEGSQPESAPPDTPPQNPETSVDLNPNPDPLLLPTKPEEVEIKNIVPLTLEQSVELAKRNNRQLQITRLRLAVSRASLDQAEAALFPTLAVRGEARRQLDATGELSVESRKKTARNAISAAEAAISDIQAQLDVLEAAIAENVDPNDPDQLQRLEQIEQILLQQQLQQQQGALQSSRNELDAKNFASTALDGRITLDYTIFSLERQANISFFSEDVRFNELDVERQEEQLRLDVALAYYDLQKADQDVRIAEGDVGDRSERLEGIELLLEAALATRLDLLNAQVELGNAIQQLRNAQARQETAQREIARLLSLPPSVTPVAADPVEITGEWNLSLEESIILALKNRVELEQQLAERRRSEADRQRELAAVIPTLSLFAEYNPLRLYSDDPSDFALRGFADGYAFGLTINWTFFDGGAAAAGIRRAEAEIAIAEQRFADSANQIRLDVERAFFQLPTQLENVQTATVAVEQAKEAVRAAQLRFQATVNTQTEVLDAQNRLIQAENNLVDAVLEYNRALVSLQRAVSQISD